VLRTELQPRGVEIVTVCLEVAGPEVARPYVEAAQPEHPSLLDDAHAMDALFGVVNVPSAIWIDEEGTIVRPAEPAWPGPAPRLRAELPEAVMERLRRERFAYRFSGERERYADALRDWAARGADSPFAYAPDEVVSRSRPRSPDESRAAAHFELAQHLWSGERRDAALAHFREAHRLQPDNWTYKRQAWSLVSRETTPGEGGRFAQMALPGEETEWPFESDFWTDVSRLGEQPYYPQTLEPPAASDAAL
jgi:hypothetical protein